MTAPHQPSEEVLYESETRYQRLFEHAHEGIFRITTEGHFAEVNPMFVSLLGYDSAQEILSFSSQDALYIDSAQYQRVRQTCNTAGSVRNMELL
jgi:PAS domain S-box-containing protein